MALAGFLLDLDGTLIDTNGIHAKAWLDAFEQRGYRVARDRVDVELGKGGDRLVADILGEEAEKKDGAVLRALQAKAFARRADREGIAVMPGAEPLLAALRDRGLKTALATSSASEHIAIAERASGVAWSLLVDEVIGEDDVDASKPQPDVVRAAAEKLKLHPAQCALVGDTPWDARAGVRGGVVVAGVTAGGRGGPSLCGAGARAVYRDPAEIVDRLDEVLRRLSPGASQLDGDALATLMRHALRVAEEGMLAGEVPIGAVLARSDGTILGRGFNRANATRDRSRHAELVAFSDAAPMIHAEDRDLVLVSTLEPCVMCTGAAMQCAIDAVVYGLPAPADAGTLRVTPPESCESQMPRIVGRVLEREARHLFEQWLDRPSHDRGQEPYVQQLFRLTERK